MINELIEKLESQIISAKMFYEQYIHINTADAEKIVEILKSFVESHDDE